MKRRNPYSDLGLTIAITVFLCILVKSLLFGITWVGIIWFLLSIAYFILSWKFSSDSKIVRHSTTVFIVLSIVAIIGLIMFDKNARPKMHAFEGNGDTIKDMPLDAEGPYVDMLDDITSDPITDTIHVDSVANVEESRDEQETSIESENNKDKQIDSVLVNQ